MKRIPLIVIILIVGYFLIFYKPDNQEVSNSNQSVSTETIVEPKESMAEKIKVKTPEVKQVYDPLADYDKETDKTPDVDYVTAFREFQGLKKCRYFLEDIEKGVDLFEKLNQRHNKYKNESNPWIISVEQELQFNNYIENCQSMLMSLDEKYTSAHERYRKRFYQTKPETKEAKDLEQSWNLRVTFRNLSFKNYYLNPNLNLEPEDFQKAINKEIRHYKGMLRYINRNEDIEFSQRTRTEINMFQSQSDELQNLLDGTIEVNQKYLEQLNQDYLAKLEKVKRFLEQNTSGEAFLSLAPIVYGNKNIELGFYDQEYFKVLMKSSMIVYACSLGMPCSPDNEFMTMECILKDFPVESACGQTIEDYYLGYYFTPNQLIDFKQLIDVYLGEKL